MPPAVAWFPETLAMVPRLMPEGGLIIRSIPMEMKEGSVVPAPLFSLMGGSGSDPPLLLQMLGQDAELARSVVTEVLLAKFAGIWVDLVFGMGLMLEAHGQDLLLALSKDMVPCGGFYYRDFEGLTVDWGLRRARGLSEGPSLPHSCDWYETYETLGYPLHQLVSWKIRTSLFDYICLVLAELDLAAVEWRTRGLMPSGEKWEGELTMLFSRHLRKAIRERYGMREDREYDIHRDLSRFVKFLMRVRSEVLQSKGSSR